MNNNLIGYLKELKVINKYQTTFDAKAIFKDIKIIVLFYSSVRDTRQEHTEVLKKLISLHKLAHEKCLRLEVLHIPTDLCQEQANACFIRQGNWYSLYADSNTSIVNEFLFLYGISSTPRIIAINRDGSIISRYGYEDILKYGNGALDCWI